MKIKTLEVRDQGTRISVLAINMNNPHNGAQYAHLRACGYPCTGQPNIGITRLDANGGEFWNDPWAWRGGDRTWPTAHKYIIEHWDELEDGDVVCVETILGERTEPKVGEIYVRGK